MSRRPREVTVEAEEAAPEADRLDGFPHPRETLDLVGQSRAEQALLAAWRSGHLHHAWMLTGPEGIGKATLAYRFARFLLAGAPEDTLVPRQDLSVSPALPAARQIQAQAHPGLLVIRRAYDLKTKRFPASITVDEVRRLKDFLSLTAEAGAWRVVIVDRADEMNVNAANALLKSLEEPPARTLFLLVTAEPGRILRTIRSRARRLDLAPLGAGDLERALTTLRTSAGEPPLPSAEIATLATLSGGSVRKSLVLTSGDGLALYERLLKIAGAAKPEPEILKLVDQVPAAGGDTAPFVTVLDLLEGLMGRLARHAATGEGALPAEARLAARLGKSDQLATWAELWETVGRVRAEALGLQLDRKALLLDLLMRLTGPGSKAA
jgi:DNA polymerase-3 subunit delta'